MAVKSIFVEAESSAICIFKWEANKFAEGPDVMLVACANDERFSEARYVF